MSLDSDVNLKTIADNAKDASGADLKSICTEAGMFAIREEHYSISAKNFEDALDKVLNKNKNQGLSKESGVMYN